MVHVYHGSIARKRGWDDQEMLYFKEFIIMLMLAVVVVGNLLDIVHDYREGVDASHLAIELMLIVASFALIGFLSIGIWRQTRSNRQLKEELASLSGSPPSGLPPEVQAARHGLAEVVQQQFKMWSLTRTEKEVAMLMLKGLSFKEIASVRDTLEKTVRQQASGIYRKAGVNGRHEFSAWFIEDFL
jgi:DNA-binding CsgD family transcriptional regulator